MFFSRRWMSCAFTHYNYGRLNCCLIPIKPLSRSKAAIFPQKQVFAASACGPMKHAKTKGSKRSSDSSFCCLCPQTHETYQDQRQQTLLRFKILLPPLADP